jgi:hypothetical protein
MQCDHARVVAPSVMTAGMAANEADDATESPRQGVRQEVAVKGIPLDVVLTDGHGNLSSRSI